MVPICLLLCAFALLNARCFILLTRLHLCVTQGCEYLVDVYLLGIRFTDESTIFIIPAQS